MGLGSKPDNITLLSIKEGKNTKTGKNPDRNRPRKGFYEKPMSTRGREREQRWLLKDFQVVYISVGSYRLYIFEILPWIQKFPYLNLRMDPTLYKEIRTKKKLQHIISSRLPLLPLPLVDTSCLKKLVPAHTHTLGRFHQGSSQLRCYYLLRGC